MPFELTAFNVGTIVLIAGALILAYSRTRNRLDSNFPLIYYGILIAYTNALPGRLSPWVVYAGMTLGLLLRFEFMNRPFTMAIQTLEVGVLAVIVYECGSMVLGR